MPERLTAPASFTFLNQPVNFNRPDTIDWNYADNGKLWTYNLNYFEYLRQPDLPVTTGQALIDNWIGAEPRHLDGWEPYPTSLRIVNWIQFYRAHQTDIPTHVKESLLRQQFALTDQVEFHIDGNHLLENSLSLCLLQRCVDADLFSVASADQLLREELDRQYLPDGAHFELAPMYHFILLWRQLDVYSILGADDTLHPLLNRHITSQLSYAKALCSDSGSYPHFNDSANNIAPSVRAIFNYAEALGFTDIAPATLTSGYVHWSWPGINLWIDAAPIGASYISSHAHADALHFILSVNGEPFIVDTGISTYEKNDRRAYERSTAAHNTVTVNGSNSSDVWAGFRVGERSRTVVLEQGATGGRRLLRARHDGYRSLGIDHQRTFEAYPGQIRITDKLIGPSVRGVARLHLVPRFTLLLQESTVVGEGARITFTGLDPGGLSVRSATLAQGFNQLAPGCCVEVQFTGELITTISFDEEE